jgi:signal transduction histidine kinase
MEVRLKRLYQPPSGEAEYARVLCHSSARLEDNEVKSVMTIITDVSAFRWAEASEARRATQAEEAKRLQEDFIDFVSHELRNPLSAIFQLAETILTSFPPNGIGQSTTNTELTDALRSNIDNASTILLCAQHQKRIVDDVLTLSKLEYTMLSVSPRPTRLPALVERWMKMFEAQLVSYDIQLKIIPHHSIADKNNSWVLCDESRIQQIFLNLMTNAIKFTKAERKRQLTVEYSVVLSEPRTNFPSDIRWAPNQREFEDLTLEPVWGLGQPIFLTFAIRDTGIGMTSEEIRKLFGRFEQANARTTIKYGGSVSSRLF